MGTVLECQGERSFQNLEQCHEIQGEITTKIVYPLNHPCYVGGISLKTKRNFETEEKIVQFDSNNILETYQNSNYKSDDKYNLEKDKNKDIRSNDLKNNKETNNKKYLEDEEMEVNDLIEDENNENEKDEKDKNEKDKLKLKENNIKVNKQLKNVNNNDILNNKKYIKNISNSDDNFKIIENEIDLYYNQIIENKIETIKNKNLNLINRHQIKPNESSYIISKKNNNQKFKENKINNNLIFKNKRYSHSPESKYNNIKYENIYNKKEKIGNIIEKSFKNKLKNDINKNKNKSIKYDKFIDSRLVNKYNNNSNINKILKNQNKFSTNNNSKRSSCTNKNNLKSTNNTFRYSRLNKIKKINNTCKIKKNFKKDLDKNKEQNLLKSTIPKKQINQIENEFQNPQLKKNSSYQNLISNLFSDSLKSNKYNNNLKNNALFQPNLDKRKIRNNIPVYRRLSPEERTKKNNNRRFSYLSNSNKNIYTSPRSESGPKNYNFRDDLWDYFKKDPFLNTSKKNASKNIINMTRHISQSRSDNNFNSLVLNNYDYNNNYNNDIGYNICHQYNRSMNFNNDNLLNKIYKKKLKNTDNDNKLLYSNQNKNYFINLKNNIKNENNIKDFIKVRIPFNGTQICPILINYSTNNIFILNYNNLNKFNDKSILYDGNIFKVINTPNENNKLILRYFQITKNCFRYYNNIYSVLIYNENPLVQFDIRHIENIQIINLNLFNIDEKKIEYAFSINLINNSDFFIFATDDKEFGNSIVNVLNLLRKYYKDERDLFE